MKGDFTGISVPICGHRAVVSRFVNADERPEWSIIALHGFTGSAADFGPMRQQLTGCPTEWLCPDFMGHGNSDAPSNVDPYRLTAMLALIDRTRRLARRPDKVFLLAYSMGGRLAVHYLRWASPLPTILIGASPGIEDAVERGQRQDRDTALINPSSGDIGEFCDKWEGQALIQPQTRLPEPLRSELASRRRKNSLVGLSNSLAGCGAGALPSLWENLPALPGLTCLYGERDDKFAGIARRMQEANPAITGKAIPDAGHAPHLENPEAVAAELKFHLDFC